MSDFCNPMDCSPPGFLVLHCLPEFAQTQVHWVGDAIQPSHLLLPASPFALNLSQHQGLFQWAGSSHQMAKVVELQVQHQSFNEYSGLISFRIVWFDLLAVQGTLKFSPASLCKSINSSALNLFMVQLSHLYMTNWKNHGFDYIGLCRQSDVSAFQYAV